MGTYFGQLIQQTGVTYRHPQGESTGSLSGEAATQRSPAAAAIAPTLETDLDNPLPLEQPEMYVLRESEQKSPLEQRLLDDFPADIPVQAPEVNWEAQARFRYELSQAPREEDFAEASEQISSPAPELMQGRSPAPPSPAPTNRMVPPSVDSGLESPREDSSLSDPSQTAPPLASFQSLPTSPQRPDADPPPLNPPAPAWANIDDESQRRQQLLQAVRAWVAATDPLPEPQDAIATPSQAPAQAPPWSPANQPVPAENAAAIAPAIEPFPQEPETVEVAIGTIRLLIEAPPVVSPAGSASVSSRPQEPGRSRPQAQPHPSVPRLNRHYIRVR